MFEKNELEFIGNLLMNADIKGRDSAALATIINKIVKELNSPAAAEPQEDE